MFNVTLQRRLWLGAKKPWFLEKWSKVLTLESTINTERNQQKREQIAWFGFERNGLSQPCGE